MGRNLNDFLKQAGVAVAGAQPAAVAPATTTTAAPAKTAAAATPAKTAAPAAKVADIAASQPSKGEAGGGHKPREKKVESEAQDTGATGGDTAAASTKGAAVTKTATQITLEKKGIIIPDAKTAEAVYGELVKQAELEKKAELEKFASEMRAQGALIYQGMCIESTAIKLATGEATIDEARAVAQICGVGVDGIVKRAEQIGGAMSSPALVGGMLGSAARTDSSKVMAAGERNGSTTETRDIEAISGTRGAVSGSGDDKLKRFTDVATMPGNPGVNHGQVVDQGKKLGE